MLGQNSAGNSRAAPVAKRLSLKNLPTVVGGNVSDDIADHGDRLSPDLQTVTLQCQARSTTIVDPKKSSENEANSLPGASWTKTDS